MNSSRNHGTSPTCRVFFYGLFMDPALLADQDLHAVVIGPAVLHGYRIHIGARATLLPSPSSRVLGVVMELSEPDVRALYSEPTVRAYRREPVCVTLLASGRVLEAQCYNLPPDSDLAGTNPDYAEKLARLAEALGLEAGYVREIAAFGLRP